MESDSSEDEDNLTTTQRRNIAVKARLEAAKQLRLKNAPKFEDRTDTRVDSKGVESAAWLTWAKPCGDHELDEMRLKQWGERLVGSDFFNDHEVREQVGAIFIRPYCKRNPDGTGGRKGQFMALKQRAMFDIGGALAFPGGDIPPGMSSSAALKEMLLDQVGVVPTKFEMFMESTTYMKRKGADVNVHLYYYRVDEWRGPAGGDMQTLMGQQMLWLTAAQGRARVLDFVEAEKPIVLEVCRKIVPPPEPKAKRKLAKTSTAKSAAYAASRLMFGGGGV
jgi:hypothetical protein